MKKLLNWRKITECQIQIFHYMKKYTIMYNLSHRQSINIRFDHQCKILIPDETKEKDQKSHSKTVHDYLNLEINEILKASCL